MRLQSSLILCAPFFVSVSNANADSPPPRLSHSEAIAGISGLMYIHGMAQKCPFPKNTADTFEIVAAVTAAGLPRISPEETADAAKQADARVARDIADSKEESCQKAQNAAVAMASVLARQTQAKKP